MEQSEPGRHEEPASPTPQGSRRAASDLPARADALVTAVQSRWRSRPTDADVEVPRPQEAAAPLRRPLPLVGTALAGFAMGVAEVVPGFSGGTVALVAGIYERLIAAIRQGARTLSLLLRAHVGPALRSLALMDWFFLAALLVGMFAALLTVADPLRTLIDERPFELSAVFLGLVLGAAAVAARRLRDASAWYLLVGLAATALAFYGLGASPGAVTDPSLLVILLAGAVAISAWILPGVSGSFLLLVLGLYPVILDALADRQVGVLLVFAVGCTIGLALFSTALNWLLARFHDLVLSLLIGLMAGSARVLWPWPEDAGFGSPELAAPVGDTAFLAAALSLSAFAVVWLLGLVATGLQQAGRRYVTRRGSTGPQAGFVPAPEPATPSLARTEPLPEGPLPEGALLEADIPMPGPPTTGSTSEGPRTAGPGATGPEDGDRSR